MSISISQTRMSHYSNGSWGAVAIKPHKLTNTEHKHVAKPEPVETMKVIYSGLDILAIYNKGLSQVNKISV